MRSMRVEACDEAIDVCCMCAMRCDAMRWLVMVFKRECGLPEYSVSGIKVGKVVSFVRRSRDMGDFANEVRVFLKRMSVGKRKGRGAREKRSGEGAVNERGRGRKGGWKKSGWRGHVSQSARVPDSHDLISSGASTLSFWGTGCAFARLHCEINHPGATKRTGQGT